MKSFLGNLTRIWAGPLSFWRISRMIFLVMVDVINLRRNERICDNDLWIAAHAKAENLILDMNNEREFKRIPGLTVQNWA